MSLTMKPVREAVAFGPGSEAWPGPLLSLRHFKRIHASAWSTGVVEVL